MSLTLAIRTALSGLTVSQTAVQVASDNIANATTEGFTRKSVDIESRRIITQGAGVQAGDISRDVDSFLIGQIRDQLGVVGEQTIRDGFLQNLQGLFGTPENNRSFSSLLTDLKNAFETAALTPETATGSIDVASISLQLGQIFNELSDAMQQLRLDADNQITQELDVVNRNLDAVASLNLQIARAINTQKPTATLEDERDKAIAAISEIMDIHVAKNSDGMVSVFSGGGRTLVNGGIAETFSHTSAAQMNASVYYVKPTDPAYPGAISGIFIGGTATAADDTTTEFGSGRLKALIDLRDSELPNLQAEIDRLAQTVLEQVNAAHNAGTAYPPPSTLTGSQSFAGGDVFSAAGTVRIAVINQADGTVIENLDLALGGLATIGDVVTSIDGMANVSASLNAAGQLVVTTGAAGQGIAITDLSSAVTTVGATTRGFSHYLGLNDLFHAGVNGSDYTAFSTGQLANSTAALGLTGTLSFDGNGFSTTVNYAAGDSLEAIAASINANGTLAGENITATVVDEGPGRRLIVRDGDKENFLMTDSGTLISGTGLAPDPTNLSTIIAVRAELLRDPALVARGTLSQAGVLAPGDIGITRGDGTNAAAIAAALESDVSFAATGSLAATTTSLSRYGATILAVQATLAARADDNLAFSGKFLETLEFRNAAISGVNIDEEMANLVILEQAYNASARVITVANEMLDELFAAFR
jgi:flagellar hook-associated protein 1 FlgK